MFIGYSGFTGFGLGVGVSVLLCLFEESRQRENPGLQRVLGLPVLLHRSSAVMPKFKFAPSSGRGAKCERPRGPAQVAEAAAALPADEAASTAAKAG